MICMISDMLNIRFVAGLGLVPAHLLWSDSLQFRRTLVCLFSHSILSLLSLFNAIFKYYLLHGSVAICLRCDVIFSGQFIANLPLSVPVKEF